MTTFLGDPLRNKGTAFTEEERARPEIEGLLPSCTGRSTVFERLG